jgi:hypothetical protein
MKILFEHSIAKVGKEDILKPAVWNESLHEISKNNLFRV